MLERTNTFRIHFPPAAALILLGLIGGCGNPGARARLAQENLTLREDQQRLERTVGGQAGEIVGLERQIANLKRFGPNQPADLFAPVQIEIARLSGGADYDGEPGDDGVTVHIRPRDDQGDAVKVPGRITIRLTDDADITSPRVLGVHVFDDPNELRRAWHSRFGALHYTLKCPFPSGLRPTSNKVTVHAEFTDYLTGRTLTAVKEVNVSMSNRAALSGEPNNDQ